MINFILLAWDTDNPSTCETVKQLRLKTQENIGYWQEAFNADGLIAYAQRPTSRNVFNLDNSAGVILGRLYRNTTSPDEDALVQELSKAESDTIVDSRGQDLTDNFWGSYVSVLQIEKSKLLIGRDCSGLQLCYTTWHNGVFIAFSNFDSLPFIDDIRKDINWDYLATIGQNKRGSFSETGLISVQQLAAGEVARVNLRNKEVNTYRSWKPEEYAVDLIEDPLIAQNTLYQTVLAVVKAQSQDYNSISIMLSGGLDSSILLACLRKFHPAESIHATHLHSTENDVSEDHYAQSMADAYGVDMEIVKQEAGKNEGFASYASPPWPIPVDRENTNDEEYKQRQHDYERKGIDGVFKGQGGDQIFFKKPQIAPLYDYQKKHLFDPRYFQILLNTARLTEYSVWKLRRMARNRGTNSDSNSINSNVFLSKDMSENKSVDSFDTHPWLQAKDTLPFGKHHQLKSFTYFDQYAQRYTSSTPIAPSIPPFISQPLMELMLRIPTYILLANGRNRGLARETFKQELTPEVYNRENKGFMTRFVFNMILMNLEAIREFLYDGILVRENFLDRKALDAYLNEDALKTKVMTSDIHFAIKYERWARSLA